MLKYFTTLAILLLVISQVQSQDCGCDLTLQKVSGKNHIDADGIKLNAQPGNRICIPAGQYDFVRLVNFKANKNSPIEFINCGGQVNIGGFVSNKYGIQLLDVEYFRLTGTGQDGLKYGFKIDGVNEPGTGISGYGTNGEIDHFEIANIGFAGIMYKKDPSCGEPEFWEGNHIVDNLIIHDNYIHDTHGEGMYIGFTGTSRNCTDENGNQFQIFPHKLKNVKAYNNITERTGWDGIQFSQVIEGCEVYSNIIRDYGLENKGAQRVGLVIGGGSSGKYYNNVIIGNGRDFGGGGIHVYGAGEVFVYNNTIINPGEDGIFCDDRTTISGKGFRFLHNTVIEPIRTGFRMYSTQSSNNEFINNIVIDSEGDFLEVWDEVDWENKSNFLEKSIAVAEFVNPSANDFTLNENSPAIDAGFNLSSYPYFKFNIDQNFLERPYGNGFDIGAHEYGAEPSDDKPIDPPIDPDPGKKLVYPPKFFTPNDDGVNDFWVIENVVSISECSLIVLDENGQKVFEANPYSNNWDGTHNNQPLPEGAYYYIIKCSDNPEKNDQSGGVRIIR